MKLLRDIRAVGGTFAGGYVAHVSTAVNSKEREKVFRDPVHDLIAIAPQDRFILDLIDTPEVQRLRRVRQLGMSCFIYQGAEHSRFTHSLGTYHCVCRILDSLRRNHNGQNSIKKVLVDIDKPVKAAGLLHDIGHGPFSHVFERSLGAGGLKHEDWTTRIIESPDSCIYAVLNDHGIDPGDVTSIIRKSPPAHSLAIDIISSELDADRMDYLLRDSLMCGVNYGVFDLEWMLHTMHAAQVEELGSRRRPMKLCADATKGIKAVETYVLSRVQMYEQVYYHKTTRACESLLTLVLEYAQHLAKGGWSPPGVTATLGKLLSGEGQLSIQEYLSLDDFCLTTMLREWSTIDTQEGNQRDLQSLVRQLVDRKKPFKWIWIDDTRKQRAVGAMQQSLIADENPLRFHCCCDEPDNIAYKGVLYTLGRKEPGEDQINSTIYVLTDGQPKPVETASDVLAGLAGVNLKKCRLYYDREKEQDFKNLFSKFDLS